jgi:hypothetical protein
VAVDATGRVHVIGTTESADFPRTAAAVPSPGGAVDAFYTRFSAYGTVEFSMRFGGSRGDVPGGVAVDESGDAYVAGWTVSRDFPLQRALKPSFPDTAGSQAFVAKFTSAGLDFSTYLGGSNSDTAYAVAVSSSGVYVGGVTCSNDFPGAPARTGPPCNGAGFVSKIRSDGSAVIGSVLLDGGNYDDRVLAVAVDGSDNVFATGYTNSSDFPVTPDAEQIAPSAAEDAFFARIAMSGSAPFHPLYATYLGRTRDDLGFAVTDDRAGGAWVAGRTLSDYPPANAAVGSGTGLLAHFVPSAAPPPASDDVVLYARDASAIAGNWTLTADTTAAAGVRVENPDAGAAKIAAAAAAPANYVELTFQAQAGVPYHLWLRMKAANDSWTNDSVFVQFSDSVTPSGAPVWQIGTTSATVVSLEDCTGCGEQRWGWNDNGYNVAGDLVTFATNGTHTVRVQQREDGVGIDQVVLSSRTYINAAPGAAKNDATILMAPTPPPPPDSTEIVLYAGGSVSLAGAWEKVGDATAAGGTRLHNPDAAQAKLTAAAAAPASYFEMTFDARAGVAYRVWMRMKADADSWQNDSVFVQFSDSVDGSGSAAWRIGTTGATTISLEDCSGCGEQGWGWNDNGYGTPGMLVTFATGGRHTIRVQQREDGISIDQIVLSAAAYLDQAPGAAKNDGTIVPR